MILGNVLASACIVLLALTALWLISLRTKDASLIDIFWGAGFGLIAITCLWRADIITPYMWLLAGLPVLWAVRLSLYLAKRNLGHGEDKRYIAMRKRSGLDEMTWRRRAFFTVYLGQGLLMMIISAPIWVSMTMGVTTPLGLAVGIGAALWLIGFLFETIGDAQLAAFMAKMKDYNGAYDDKPILDSGLWKYTRHPNYFGNACMWWGTWIIAAQAPWGWVTIFAPLLMTVFLTRVSGRDLLERQMNKRPAYRDYVKRTSGFVPWFPKTNT